MQKVYAIIAAGGQGSRLATDIPKQFLLLNGLPVLFYSVQAFSKCVYQPEIIIALKKEYQSYWNDLCKTHNFTIAHKIVDAGNTRSMTVKNAINSIREENSLVAIHDGARPLISTELINKLYLTASIKGSSVPVLNLIDAIAGNKDNRYHSFSKKDFWLVQTPQCFITKNIKSAYDTLTEESQYDDDASIIETTGLSISVIEGQRRNIKITYNDDLIIASALLDTIKAK